MNGVEFLDIIIGKSINVAEILVAPNYYIRDETGTFAGGCDAVSNRINVRTDDEDNIISYTVG